MYSTTPEGPISLNSNVKETVWSCEKHSPWLGGKGEGK